MKRFWKTVGIGKQGDAHTVTLDKRPLKTPAGKTLLLPERKALLATLIAHEWETQEKLLKPHALPIVRSFWYRFSQLAHPFFFFFFLQTSLASRAIDALGEDQTRAEVRASLLDYLDTDTIWLVAFHPFYLFSILTAISFFQDEPPQLVTLQEKHWVPLLHWARTNFGVEIQTFDSILFNSQPEATKRKFDDLLANFDAWEMAGRQTFFFSMCSVYIDVI